MKKSWWFLLVLGGLVVSVGLVGCGGDDDDDPAPVEASEADDTVDAADADDAAAEEADGNVAVAGTWKGTRSNDDGSSAFTMTLAQSSDALTGAYSDHSGFEGTVTGTIDGDDIELAIMINDAPAPWVTPLIWNFDGAANADGTELSGTLETGADPDHVEATKQ